MFSSFDIYEKPYENWNKKWESEFEIININDQCSIRASFHPPTNKKFDIIINPEMSFGTGHHETTRLMAKELFNHKLNEKSVLDFGSGTAILSIISAKLGAKYIDAVEIDNKVNDSALENLKINNINKQLNVKSSNVTVLVEVSFKDEIDVIKKFITDEQSPLFYELNDDGIIRFEWFLNEENKTGILIEEFKNSNVWEELGNKVLGSPINLRFRELFKVEKLTVLGDINETFKEKIQGMNPIINSYAGGVK